MPPYGPLTLLKHPLVESLHDFALYHRLVVDAAGMHYDFGLGLVRF